MNYKCPVNSSLRNASIFRNLPTHKLLRSPPEYFAIGYVHNDNLPLGNIALQYVIQNKCRKVCFLMMICTFWRSRKKLLNSPKLSCGFNNSLFMFRKDAQNWLARYPDSCVFWCTLHNTMHLILHYYAYPVEGHKNIQFIDPCSLFSCF